MTRRWEPIQTAEEAEQYALAGHEAPCPDCGTFYPPTWKRKRQYRTRMEAAAGPSIEFRYFCDDHGEYCQCDYQGDLSEFDS